MAADSKPEAATSATRGRPTSCRRFSPLTSCLLLALALASSVRVLEINGHTSILPAAAAGPLDRLQQDPQANRRRPALNAAARFGGHAIWSDLEGWRRNKRDIEDRLVLASRRAAASRRRADGAPSAAGRNKDEDFAIDDGDEDAWVHDGVDDIHIDPETKRAASELSRDEGATIDAEYDPNNVGGSGGGQESESPPVVNRTRVTTISEVIPMNSDDLESTAPSASRRGAARPWSGQRIQMVASAASPHGPLLPASYLTLEQVQRLIDAQQRDKQRGEEDPEEE